MSIRPIAQNPFSSFRGMPVDKPLHVVATTGTLLDLTPLCATSPEESRKRIIETAEKREPLPPGPVLDLIRNSPSFVEARFISRFPANVKLMQAIDWHIAHNGFTSKEMESIMLSIFYVGSGVPAPGAHDYDNESYLIDFIKRFVHDDQETVVHAFVSSDIQARTLAREGLPVSRALSPKKRAPHLLDQTKRPLPLAFDMDASAFGTTGEYFYQVALRILGRHDLAIPYYKAYESQLHDTPLEPGPTHALFRRCVHQYKSRTNNPIVATARFAESRDRLNETLRTQGLEEFYGAAFAKKDLKGSALHTFGALGLFDDDSEKNLKDVLAKGMYGFHNPYGPKNTLKPRDSEQPNKLIERFKNQLVNDDGSLTFEGESLKVALEAFCEMVSRPGKTYTYRQTSNGFDVDIQGQSAVN